MRDKELCLEVLRQIEEAAEKTMNRFKTIHPVSDFTDSPEAVEKMDSICMMMIVIGESLKTLIKSPKESCCLNTRLLIGRKPKACETLSRIIMPT